MFAPNVVGTANAMTGGWGNMGGGFTQKLMPALFGLLVAEGLTKAASWRVSMVIAGVICLLTGVAYFLWTQDTPQGNLIELRKAGIAPPAKKGSFATAAADPRVWCLFVLYGACFGVELTIDNIAHLYFHDYFHMGLATAGWAALCFGGLNLFARALGGFYSDRMNLKKGLNGRVGWLFAVILVEGICMMVFSQMTAVVPMLLSFMLFGLFVCMSCGAVYGIVPFINKNAVGSVSGIVGAGGNAAAVGAGFLFGKTDWHHSLLLLGGLVTAASFLTLGVKFSAEDEVPEAAFQPGLSAGEGAVSPV
jgi:NNP family nitrate/nitrite transporter-like MFS transporter